MLGSRLIRLYPPVTERPSLLPVSHELASPLFVLLDRGTGSAVFFLPLRDESF